MGLLADDDKDVERRKQLATVALNKLNNVWIKGNIPKTSTKIELYKNPEKSILLHILPNMGTYPNKKERPNAYHRKQLKKILNISYPKKITSK